jgi:hypothetical protein
MAATVLDNAVRGRFNAWFFDALEGYMHWKYAAIKSQLLADVPPVLVELGPGAGGSARMRGAIELSPSPAGSLSSSELFRYSGTWQTIRCSQRPGPRLRSRTVPDFPPKS